MNGYPDGCMDELMDGWDAMDSWIGGQIDGWMEGWMGGWLADE